VRAKAAGCGILLLYQDVEGVVRFDITAL